MRSIEKKSLQPRQQQKKDERKRSEPLIPSFSPEDLVRLGKQYEGLESPIDISFPILTEANLRPLEWVNFENKPKRMKLSNSGTTAILSAKWHGPRPYLTKGPLTGYYVFSQLHFHWGKTFEEGSEHTMDGRSLPLEAHAMFFKNTYLTQEDAMNKTDGTITIAYLFTLQSNDNEDLNSIISALNEIRKPLSSYHLELLPLEKFLHSFTDDYFMYWGNVVNRSILWLICRRPLGISARQLSTFHNLTGINEYPISNNFRRTKELNHRIVYHINPSKYRSDLLIGVLRDSRIKRNRPGGHAEVKNSVDRGDGKPAGSAQLSTDGSVDRVREKQVDDSILFNISVHADEKLENITSRSGVGTADEVSSLRSSTSQNEAINLEKRRKSEIKFQLASALLNLEKEEGNDYAFLEKYLRSKSETLQDEQFYETPSSDEKRGGDMLLPSVRSLRVNSSESLDGSVVLSAKDKTKSDTNFIKGYLTSDECDKTSIEGSIKSGLSSINIISGKEDREEKMEDQILPSRPRTSAAKSEDTFTNIIDEEEEKMPTPQNSRRLNLATPPVRSKTSFIQSAIIRKPLSYKEKSQKEVSQEWKSKTPASTVDEAREKIRSTLKQSISKLSKLRGASPKNTTNIQKPGSGSSRPAWRY